MDPWLFVVIALVLVVVSLFRPRSKGERKALELHRANNDPYRHRP